MISSNADVYTVPSMKVYKRAVSLIRSKTTPILLPSGIQTEPFLIVDKDKMESIRYYYRLNGK